MKRLGQSRKGAGAEAGSENRSRKQKPEVRGTLRHRRAKVRLRKVCRRTRRDVPFLITSASTARRIASPSTRLILRRQTVPYKAMICPRVYIMQRRAACTGFPQNTVGESCTEMCTGSTRLGYMAASCFIPCLIIRKSRKIHLLPRSTINWAAGVNGVVRLTVEDGKMDCRKLFRGHDGGNL